MSAIVGLIGMLGLGALFLGPIAAALAGREAAPQQSPSGARQ